MHHPSPSLAALGWRDTRTAHLPEHAAEWLPARVVRCDRGGWTLAGAWPDPPVTTLLAELRGRLRNDLRAHEFPAVGDWVLATPRAGEARATIEAVLPRTSALVRHAAGPVTEAQVVAANVDVVLVAVPLDAPANPRRLERELAAVWESGAVPVVVATKADLVDDADEAIDWIVGVAAGVEVVAVDALTGGGVAALEPWLQHGATLVLFGPSGAGKSTLANHLLGDDLLDTGEVREGDRRGRHTTTHRELIELPSGALLIDTPGIRELGLWDADDGLAATFGDVEEVAARCRFGDCGHRGEPGCAVRAAITEGSLAPERLASWDKLRRELAHQARRSDARLATEERKRWAAISREASKRARR
jgi:ribosome biogenesis GTPase